MADTQFKPLLLDLLRQAQISQNAFFEQLPPAELTALGAPDFWSAKDHVAHIAYWRRRQVFRVEAILAQKPQPESEDFLQLNPLIFEEQQDRLWPDILAESDQIYAELIDLTGQLQEEDLFAVNQFGPQNNGLPFYISFLGNCYEHSQNHLAQYLFERHDLGGATQMYEAWANRVLESAAPDLMKGFVLYNLACFYATHSQPEKAGAPLQQAFALMPDVRDFAETDPDLADLRPFAFA